MVEHCLHHAVVHGVGGEAIVVEGRERLPKDGAVLFVANHPNSLLDPALIVAHGGRIVHFAAKDVLFKSALLRVFLRGLGAVPLARNAAGNQAYRIGSAAWGLQFHIEVDRPTVEWWMSVGRWNLDEHGVDVRARDEPRGPRVVRGDHGDFPAIGLEPCEVADVRHRSPLCDPAAGRSAWGVASRQAAACCDGRGNGEDVRSIGTCLMDQVLASC